jgi:beta-N-acetylhexosaminidase
MSGLCIPKAFICGVAAEVLRADEAAFLREHQPYGVILFARNCHTPAQVTQLVSDIKNALQHPYTSILIDQEGGRVARLKPPHWRAYPAAATLAAHPDSSSLITLNAQLMAADLRALGITTDCAPLADVPAPDGHDIIGDRAFGTTPDAVIAGARAQANGLRDGGILPVLKHIPGHGRATADSHLALPEVHASRTELEATDFAPFKALRDLPLGMTAHIRYHALDAEHVSTFSPTVISLIRNDIGFDGLLMSDDLSMKALSGDFSERTTRSLQAGCDLALHCNGNMAEMQAVASAATIMHDASLARADRALGWLPNAVLELPEDAIALWEARCAA